MLLDGIVGRATWSKLYEVYNDAANDLLAPNLRPGDYPGVLRVGSSGRAVRELQFYLYILSAYQSSIPAVSIDGRFGPSTEASVRAYQKFAGLTVDGSWPCYLGFAVQTGLSAAPVRAGDRV